MFDPVLLHVSLHDLSRMREEREGKSQNAINARFI